MPGVSLSVFLGLLLFTIVAVFAISVGEFEGRSRSNNRQFPSWGQWILTIIIETPATCCVMTWWGLVLGKFEGCLSHVHPVRRPFAPHSQPNSVWLQGYALHLVVVRGTPASQAPLPTLFSVDEFKLGKWPVRGFPFASHGRMGFFCSLSLEVRPLQLRAVACRGACFQSLFSAPHPSPHSKYMVNM